MGEGLSSPLSGCVVLGGGMGRGGQLPSMLVFRLSNIGGSKSQQHKIFPSCS